MRKLLLINLQIIVILGVVFGQTADFELVYEDETIYLQQGIFGQNFMKGGISYPQLNLSQELSRYPEASELYKDSWMMKMVGIGVILIGPIIGTLALATGSNDSISSSFFTAYTGSMVLSGFATMESINKLNEAVWVYNRESLHDRLFGENDDNW